MPHIEIIGAFGAGKSALAECLRDGATYEYVRDEFESNPFLKRFNADPLSCALGFGTTMLLMHADQIRTNADPAKNQVFDFSLVTNKAYAQMYQGFGLFSERAGAQYIELCQTVRDEAIKPVLRIYLDLAPEEQEARILKRGRENDAKPLFILQTLKAALDDAVAGISDGIPLLRLDAKKYDWVNSSADKDAVVRLVAEAMSQQQQPTESFTRSSRSPAGPV